MSEMVCLTQHVIIENQAYCNNCGNLFASRYLMSSVDDFNARLALEIRDVARAAEKELKREIESCNCNHFVKTDEKPIPDNE